jgi:hypothetical protein
MKQADRSGAARTLILDAMAPPCREMESGEQRASRSGPWWQELTAPSRFWQTAVPRWLLGSLMKCLH